MTIPASDFVNVTPNVLNAGGAALDLNAVMLTTSTRVPVGAVQPFVSQAAVAAYFGSASKEATKATVYFNGFDNSNVKPGMLLITQYNTAAVSAFVRGGNVAAGGLAALQALNGTLSLYVDGSEQSATVNFSAAASFSAAAALIQTALNTATAATGSVAANVVTGSIAPNIGTGSIAGTTMTISAVTSGGYAPGESVSGAGVANNTTIISQLTGGTVGGTGTYQVSVAQNVPSTTLTASGATLTVSAVTSGTLAPGQIITGSGIAADTAIAAFQTGTGGTGKYTVNIVQTVSSTTVTASGGTLTISAVSAGTIGIGDVFSGTNITTGNTVTAFLTGTGTTGTYLCSIGDTATSTAITIGGASVAVSFDSTSNGFTIASGTAGTVSTITYPTGTLAAPLLLTSATGAVISQGAAAAAPAAFMDGVKRVTQNWATFFTAFNPDSGGGISNRVAFSSWTNNQKNRFGYICFDTDAEPTTTVPSVTSLGAAIKAAGYSGTCLVWEPSDLQAAPFIAGTAASIDFTEEGGRITFAFKSQSGLVPGVTDETVAANLTANGYNFYADVATASQEFRFLVNGFVSGPFQWFDSYVNQIQLNAALQQTLLTLETVMKSVPYNTAGYTAMETSCADPVNAALNFGSIQENVPLSALQVTAVNTAAGKAIDGVLATRGWYLQILPAAPQVRQARKSPPSKFWYMDGESVQQIDLTSTNVQ